MDYITYSEKLEYIAWLAKRKATGTKKELAEKLGVSESTAKRMIAALRAKGTVIEYCPYEKQYIIE